MNNLVSTYMNYKCKSLVSFGLTIMHSYTDFVDKCLTTYINTYINCYYYNIFDTVDTCEYSREVLEKELEGKRLELLNYLSGYELIYTNNIYLERISNVNLAHKVAFFLIDLDKLRFNDKNDMEQKTLELLNLNPEFKEMLGDPTKLFIILKSYVDTINQFYKRKDHYYVIDYPLFKDHNNYVSANLVNNIELLKENYKVSLVERTFRDKKISFAKEELLIKKFIKQLLFDIYNNKKLYDKYFIEINSDICDESDDLEKILNMLDNPLIRRYTVISLRGDDYKRRKNLIDNYHYKLCLLQDFSHINDVKGKLTTIDSNGEFYYVIVCDYKAKDFDIFSKYKLVNLEDILFYKEG